MCRACWEGILKLAKWDTDYVNSLPDDAFAVIEPDYIRGKTKNKNARHVPHHAQGVKNGRDPSDHIDNLHLSTALAWVDQIEPVTQSISKDELVKRAKSHLKDHANDLKIEDTEKKKDKKQGLVKKPSNTLVESLSAEGYNFSKNGEIIENIEGSLLAIDLTNIQSDDFRQRLAEREQNEISAANFIPKPEDFITVDYRALSKVVLSQRHIDFTKGNILKKSTKLLKGVTVFPDHNVQSENWLGSVDDTWWDEESQLCGVNARVKYYVFANPKITQGIMAKALSRVSVNVWFKWEKSHDLDDYEFIKLLGSNLDGENVRFIVTRIDGYGELSLVWMGADHTAKQIGKVKTG